MVILPASEPGPGAPAAPVVVPVAPLRVVAGTALAYAVVGALALLLGGPPGYVSPLFPSAGIALATVLVYGRAALPGVLVGAMALNLGLVGARGLGGWQAAAVPLAIALAATLQAAAGAALVRRTVSQPLVLNAPRDILRFGLFGGLLACVVGASIGTPALLAAGALGDDSGLATWRVWWLGDALGVLIGAPLALTLIGQPQADWLPRRRTLGVPLLLALALLAIGLLELSRLDRQRVQATFERDADRLAAEAQLRLETPLHALQSLHSHARALGTPERDALRQASRWWRGQPIELQATGYAERVPLDALPAFEANARSQGLLDYRVIDRDGGANRGTEGAVVAIRLVEPAEVNVASLGENLLSTATQRSALLAARDSGEAAATAGFRLSQSTADETGITLYQALYRGEAADANARRAQFRGAVFMVLRVERALLGLARPGQKYLNWCLVDTDPGTPRPRLAGPVGCENPVQAGADTYQADRTLQLAGRTLELRIAAPAATVPGRQREPAWLLSMAGLLASALLGALLLAVTGHNRRTELAVQMGTAELRREMGERTQAEAALRESEARLRSILDNAPLGVMFLDPQGRIIECNKRLCDMLGRGAEALRGSVVSDLLKPDGAEQLRALRRTLLGGATDAAIDPLSLQGAQGHEIVVRISASALRNAEGRVLRMVGVVEDITEHLRLQESARGLHRAEAANRAKSEFVSRMSHELRTPLNAMIGFAQLLGLDHEPELVAHQREWAQQIQRAGWHLLEMINETLDLARIESGAVQLALGPVALAPLVAACRAMVAAPAMERRIRVADSVDTDAAAVLGDPTRLKQVVTNLLSNAVKYNRDGGAVTLTTRRLPDAGGDWVEIAVADTGMGMTPEQQAALFQPYNRLGREGSGIEGTGIGLVISRRLTELMGGSLEVTSAAGQGSIFTLRLPAAELGQAPLVRYSNSSPAPYRQRLVHYVEDNETNIEVMRGILAQRPQVKLETSLLGLDGLGAIRRSQPDLVLLDMQLPDISGLELLRHLKQDDTIAEIPVVVVSADATALHMQQALTSGALQYVTKPLDVARFLEVVDSILEEADTRWG